jgi:flagellar biosynthesis protein FlhA
MPPETMRDIVTRIGRKIEKNESAVVISSAGARYFVRQIVEPALPNVTVLSHNEIPSEVKIRSRGVIE